MVEQKEQTPRVEQVIQGLLAKPSTKPNFSQLDTRSSVLNQVRAFLPQFITSTDKLLSKGGGSMDVQINEVMEGPLAQAMQEEKMDQNAPGQRIDMDIGVGVYDIMNGMTGPVAEKEFDNQFASNGFHDTSTEQMLRVSNASLIQEVEKNYPDHNNESSMELDEISEGESDSDSDGSDEDMNKTNEMTPSETTKGSKPKKNKCQCIKGPLIQDITLNEEENPSMKEKRAAKQQQKGL